MKIDVDMRANTIVISNKMNNNDKSYEFIEHIHTIFVNI